MDDLEELLRQLKAFTPLPSDDEISEEQLEAFSEIINKLQLLKDGRSIQPLLDALGYGTGYGLYWTALHFLEGFGSDTLRPHLIDALNNGEAGTRMWAVLMLGRIRNPEDVPQIIACLSDEADLVRLHAVSAIVMVAREGAKTYLAPLIDDPSPEVRNAVRKILNT